jgi:hypothetical protein
MNDRLPPMPIRVSVAIIFLVGLGARTSAACSCGGPFVGFVEAARVAPIVVTARVLSFHPIDAPRRPRESPHILVEVLEVVKGDLSGKKRLFGHGRGDCTVDVSQFALGSTYVFALTNEVDRTAGGKPGFGLYGVCRAVSARLIGDAVEGVLKTVPLGHKRHDTRMSMREFRRVVLERDGQ